MKLIAMKKILFALSLILFAYFIGNAQNRINAYEYWFNNEYNNAVLVQTTPAQVLQLKETIDAKALSIGVHVFNIRFRDTANVWSSVVSQFFYKAPPSIAQNRQVVAYEYWFNNDYQNAVRISASASSNLKLDDLMDAKALPLGVHTFNIRFLDNANLWSSVVSQFFYKAPQNLASQSEITEYEYWFDNDFAKSKKMPVANQQTFLLSSNLDASDLSEGLHVLSIRFRDNRNLWSSTQSQFFYKVPVRPLLDNKIIAYKYWFDNAINESTHISLSVPEKNFKLNDKISLIEIPKGIYIINFQFQDSLGLWSSVVSDTVEKNSLPIARFEVGEENYCDTGWVTFVNKSIDADTYEWDFGDGNFSTDENPTHFYSQIGNYDVKLSIRDTLFSKDTSEIKSEYIRIFQTPISEITWNYDSICPNGELVLTGVLGWGNQWSTGVEADSLIINDPGTYSLTTFNPEFPACQTQSDSLIVYLKPLPISDYSYQSSDTSLSVLFQNLSAFADSYLWNFGDGVTSTLITPQHTFAANGMYETYLVATNRCGNDTSFASIDLRFVSREEIMANFGVTIYPNPSNGVFNIEFINQQGKVNLRVFDVNGKTILQNQLENPAHTSVNIDGKAGIYFIEIQTDKHIARFKVIKI